MIITKETDYALRILRVLLDGEKHSVAEMSETELIPTQFAYQILPHPEARHIADHQCNGAARGDPPAQGCAVDGRIQGGPQLPAYVGNRLHHIAVQLSDDIFLLQRELHRAAAVCKSIGFHLLHLHIL